AAAGLLAPAPAHGQAATGAIVGTVVDANGGGLPGASITVSNPATGFTRTAVAEEGGIYRFPSLPTGTYSLKVELSGFATVTTEGVIVSVATTRTINVTLKQAKVSENLTVTAEVPLVETSPAIGTVVDQQQLESLPLNGRQFANLGVLAPGTMLGYNTDPTKPNQLVVELDGGSGRNVNYVMDGGDNTDDTIGGALQNFNLESVQEFKIQTMQYKAEYGRSSGGVLTVISKTGTNEFHGSAWEFGRRKSLNSETESEKIADAAAAAAGQPEPGKADYSRDQYGASFGGPIIKDKVHFFATYEKTTIDQNYIVNSGGLYPDLDGKAVPIPSHDDLATAKVTYDIDPKNYVQVRYGYQKNDTKYGQSSLAAASNLGTVTNKYSSILAGYTAQLSADMLNEFVFQYTKFNNAITADSADPLLYYPNGFAIGRNINTPQTTNQVKYQYKDDFSFSKDIAGHSHDFKAGIGFINEPTLDGTFSTGLTGQFSMIPGPPGGPAYVVSDITKYGGFSGNATPTKQYSAYLQDDWRVTSRLTFNIGLRYDYYDALSLDQSTNPLWQLLSTQTLYDYKELTPFKNGGGRVLKNDKDDWAPRLGFSWDLTGNASQILRGGAGRFYDFPYVNATILFPAQAVQSNYGIIYEISDANGIRNPDGSFYQPGQPLPDCSLYPGATCGLAGGLPADVASPTLKPPHSDQVSLGYSWQVNASLGFNVDAVRQWYRDLPYRYRANPYISATDRLFTPLGISNNFRIWTGDGFADYQGVNLGVHLRGEKYELQGFYTLSRATGNVLGGADEFRLTRLEYQPDFKSYRDQSVNPYDPTCGGKCVGPLDTDARHRVTLAGSYRLPAGFTVSGMFRYHSGTPYTLLTADQFGNVALPAGVSHVNSATGASFSQFDLRVAWAFDFAKDLGAEVFAEMFNVFNEKNPALYTSNGQPNAYAGDPYQGEQRLIQLGARFHF
ncbi:MAG TPA: TonB-dependent receptor, partial [Thermoanaerobaculaceae bacterium]|nr:TonB-dependent receptor [Thermoanaerobaculaceae bacterium]